MSTFEAIGVRHPRGSIALIAGLLVLFASMSWHAARLESVTFDEPTHAVAGVVALTRHDFRLNTEHPFLWKLWASLPALFRKPLHLDTKSKSWARVPIDRLITPPVVHHILYDDPLNNPDAIIDDARFMMLLIGVLLGGLIALWAWRLAGPVAALTATLIYAFDPNFLGHSPLVTNDVALSLAFAAAMYATWRVGQSASAGRVVVLSLVCAAALLVKFTALLIGPIVVVLLVLRALSGEPWTLAGRRIATRSGRLAGVGAIALVCLLVAYLGVWAGYGFRFGVSPDPSVRINLDNNVQLEASYNFVVAHNVVPTPAQIAAQPKSALTRVLLFADAHRLLPEAYIDGLMYAHATAAARPTFLLGRVSLVGSWLYFPLALLVKTPLGTLLGALLALALLVATRAWTSPARKWSLLVLILPPAIFLGLALQAKLNIGLRHVFPVYPFVFIGLGAASVQALRWRPRPAGWIVGILSALVVGESVAVSPAYIAFFNTSAGGVRGGMAFLSDSNLDWGQGLKMLGAWQRAHHEPLIYLWYYGSADPARCGVHALLLDRPGKPPAGKPPDVVALSATVLQGLPVDPLTRQAMHTIEATRTPIDAVDGSIYLYRSQDVLPLLGR